jgi:large conductance mechanosensitive channel
MPLVGAVIGKPDFSSLYLVLSDPNNGVKPGMVLENAKKVDGASIFAYGNFLTVGINFLLLALVVFIMVRMINKMKKTEAEAPAAPTADQQLLTEIRDLLKSKNNI